MSNLVDVRSLEGWLVKDKKLNGYRMGIVGTQTKRYFRVESIDGNVFEAPDNNCEKNELVLSYYKHKNGKEPQGWMFLKDVTQVREVTPTCFVLEHPSRSYVLRAPTTQEHRKWVDGLTSLVSGAKRNKDKKQDNSLESLDAELDGILESKPDKKLKNRKKEADADAEESTLIEEAPAITQKKKKVSRLQAKENTSDDEEEKEEEDDDEEEARRRHKAARRRKKKELEEKASPAQACTRPRDKKEEDRYASRRRPSFDDELDEVIDDSGDDEYNCQRREKYRRPKENSQKHSEKKSKQHSEENKKYRSQKERASSSSSQEAQEKLSPAFSERAYDANARLLSLEIDERRSSEFAWSPQQQQELLSSSPQPQAQSHTKKSMTREEKKRSEAKPSPPKKTSLNDDFDDDIDEIDLSKEEEEVSKQQRRILTTPGKTKKNKTVLPEKKAKLEKPRTKPKVQVVISNNNNSETNDTGIMIEPAKIARRGAGGDELAIDFGPKRLPKKGKSALARRLEQGGRRKHQEPEDSSDGELEDDMNAVRERLAKARDSFKKDKRNPKSPTKQQAIFAVKDNSNNSAASTYKTKHTNMSASSPLKKKHHNGISKPDTDFVNSQWDSDDNYAPVFTTTKSKRQFDAATGGIRPDHDFLADWD